MNARARRWSWVVATVLIVALAYWLGRCNGGGRDAAAADGGAARQVPSAALEPTDAARSTRVARAAASASRAIAAGLADGLWDESDRQALRAQLPYLGQRETHSVLSPLFQAINAQRVRLDGPPI